MTIGLSGFLRDNMHVFLARKESSQLFTSKKNTTLDPNTHTILPHPCTKAAVAAAVAVDAIPVQKVKCSMVAVFSSRERRVFLLVFLVFMLSLGDLANTMTYLRWMGMEEMNPIAAFVIKSGSMFSLVLFKLGSVLTCISIILLVRHRWQGEFAAWIAAMVLIALTCYWSVYSADALKYQDSRVMSQARASEYWIVSEIER